MFGFFKKKAPKLSPELSALADKLIAPQALAVAIAECTKEYAEAVESGRAEFPAHRRRQSNVQSIWSDVRLEAFRTMFGFGKANLLLLADIREQNTLLSAFINERPHLEFPQPRGETVADTWQGVWQVYRYLDAIGTEVIDRETDRDSLKSQGRNILTQFTAEATILWADWSKFESAVKNGSSSLPQMPRTCIEAFWDDVTEKSKSIALTVIFGPSYEAGIAHMLKLAEDRCSKEEVSALKKELDLVRSAKRPEDISEIR